MTTHFSPNNTFPMVQQVPQRQTSDSGNTNNKLSEAIPGIVSQQRSQTSSAFFKKTTTKTLFFDGKIDKFQLFENLFKTMLKTQPKMTKVIKINHFHSHLRQNALQTFRNTSNRPKKYKLKFLITQQTAVINQERPRNMP